MIWQIICSIATLAFVIDKSYGLPVDWLEEENPEVWNRVASQTIQKLLSYQHNTNLAKNLIIFLGDGMGVNTVNAGRIRKGQKEGKNGEETITNMESLPDLALAKTYNIDAQTPDSAGTATAFLCGVKARSGIIGLNGYAKYDDCQSSFNNSADSILRWAKRAGKSVGIVTTTRVTHATPAAAYAHSASRDWEGYDGYRYNARTARQGCKDIAAQLIDENSDIDVVLGGGRSKFLPNNVGDFANSSVNGSRLDSRNLVNEWLEHAKARNNKHKFIWNVADFRRTDFKEYDQVFGLLAMEHMRYEVDRREDQEPSLSEMTLKAIDLLSKNPNGYFLLVEGGKIDHGHHENKAHKALDDFVSFDEAVGQALNRVNVDDTLVVVTADHSHTFSLGGWTLRGNPIFGISLNIRSNVSDANLTYTSILYGNGPGGLQSIRTKNLTNEITEMKNYTQEAVVYRKMATHAAEDVPVYATGPMSYLFTNTIEQNVIPHIMAYSACIGPYSRENCRMKRSAESRESSSSNVLRVSYLTFVGLIITALNF